MNEILSKLEDFADLAQLWAGSPGHASELLEMHIELKALIRAGWSIEKTLRTPIHG